MKITMIMAKMTRGMVNPRINPKFGPSSVELTMLAVPLTAATPNSSVEDGVIVFKAFRAVFPLTPWASSTTTVGLIDEKTMLLNLHLDFSTPPLFAMKLRICCEYTNPFPSWVLLVSVALYHDELPGPGVRVTVAVRKLLKIQPPPILTWVVTQVKQVLPFAQVAHPSAQAATASVDFPAMSLIK